VKRNAFEGMRTRAIAIASALDLYFRGLSLRQVQQHLEDFYGIKVTHATIYNWLKKYVQIVNKSIQNIRVKTSERWHADETLVRVKGRYVVLWNLLDSETRFHIALQVSRRRDTRNAQKLLRTGLKTTKNKPEELVTDGLASYSKAIEVLCKKADKNADQGIIHLQGPLTEGLNNKMERFYGTLKKRLKTMYHLDNEDTAKIFAEGFAAHYNFVKPHKALNGKTPAQAINATKEKKTWLTLIQEARKTQCRENQ